MKHTTLRDGITFVRPTSYTIVEHAGKRLYRSVKFFVAVGLYIHIYMGWMDKGYVRSNVFNHMQLYQILVSSGKHASM